jgi:hypothetical protein
MIHKQPQPIIVPPQFPVNDGLVLYMPFLEGSGRFTADLSGRDNHCNLNGVTWGAAKDKKGFALTFDGINDEGIFNLNMIPTSGDFTVMGWVYCEGDQPGGEDYRGACFGACTYSGNIKGALLRKNINDLQLTWGNGIVSGTKTLVPNINTTNKQIWFHAAGIYVASVTTMFCYLDAGLIASESKAYSDSGTNYKIGHSGLNGSEAYWYGQLKNIRVYSRAISLDELRKIYETEK